MSESRFVAEHVCLTTHKPFEEVAVALARQLGRFDPEVVGLAIATGDRQKAIAHVNALAGPSGLMLFGTSDHGSLLNLVDRPRKAIQYIVGNPAIAIQMTKHDLRASLYAPLRVLLYENDEGETYFEYDKPSSLFGQFGNDQVTPVAASLDQKLEALAAAAMG
jgi:uncharacterized protein (DUF302 family)